MLLKVDNLTKKIGDFQLKNISFSLPAGYILGLIGRNGAGKTSLLHCIMGLYKAERGKILIDGKSYEEAELEIRNNIGTVLNEDLFENRLTVEANADKYGKYFRNYSKEELDVYLKEFGVNPKKRFLNLSRGEKLKVQLAFALSYHPNLLILDEPTGNFDPEFRKKFIEILKEFVADGTRSVILSTHLMEELEQIGDYILYLENGQLRFFDDVETIRTEYFPKDVFTIEDWMYALAKGGE